MQSSFHESRARAVYTAKPPFPFDPFLWEDLSVNRTAPGRGGSSNF